MVSVTGRWLARRWRKVLLAVALSGYVTAAGHADTRPRLFVYLQTDTKSAPLEKTLQERMPAVAVTVFGRFRDFEEARGAHPPDAILALQPLLADRKLPVRMKATRGGQDWEPYVLLSQRAIDGALSGKLIGVVDFLGREGTQDFVAKLLKTPDVKLKRVTKGEDLLPLLQFAAADAVLVPAVAVKTVTDRSRLSLTVRELPDARVGLAALAVLNPAVQELMVAQIQGLDGETNQILRVDQWQKQ
jgi:hypothetical protein